MKIFRKIIKCPFCGQSEPTNEDLSNHIDLVHNGRELVENGGKEGPPYLWAIEIRSREERRAWEANVYAQRAKEVGRSYKRRGATLSACNVSSGLIGGFSKNANSG